MKPHTGIVVYSLLHVSHEPQTSFTLNYNYLITCMSFPGSSVNKESACKAGDPGSIPGLGRSPGEGNGNPLQHSCLENPMNGGA